MKHKKGDGLAVNTIILAALALAVLVVLIIIFTKQAGTTNKGINGCISRGGSCAQETKGVNGQTEVTCPDDRPVTFVVGKEECPGERNVCCLKA